MSSATGRPKLEIPTVRSVTRDTEQVETFESVFERDYPKVARMAYLLLGSTGEVEEVTQEAFATLFQRWDRVDNPSGFVRTAVVNRCRDLGRRRAVRSRALRRLRPVEEPSESDAVVGHEVLEALSQLEVSLRELVVLRYYLEHTVPEIAEITRTPAGTVKSRLHRALGQLAELLERG